MESFVEFVTDKRIIECISKKRATEAAKRHKDHHLHAISESHQIYQPQHCIYELTPPRRQWIQLNKDKRARNNGDFSQTISSFERTRKSVYETIMRDRKKGLNKQYLDRLNAFITRTKNRISDPNFCLSPPKIIPLLKKKHHDGPDEYRPICLFEDLSDAIIIILANRYLTKLFDQFFYEDSLAFRPKRNFHGKRTITAHHDAITLISKYLDRVKTRSIYVAECDMQKFYDTVDHDIVLSEYNKLISKSKAKFLDVNFDDITRVFNSYLSCYTFTQNVWSKNNDIQFWKEFNRQNGVFKWIEDCHHPKYINQRLGVPQGGALSGLIANIVLNRVDEEIAPKLHLQNDLYVRFCDDMLLLSTNERRCKSLLNIYNREICKVNLFPHKALPLQLGTSNYWNSKSKSVYRWGDGNKSTESRWIGFVGYEISRHGDIRIRKSSIRKEKKKQRNVINNLFELTYKKQRVNDSSMRASYHSTLISMAVGRATLWNYRYLKNELCWINGFKGLNYNPTVVTQIRDLDRCRNRFIHHADCKLDNLHSKVEGTIVKEGNNKKGKGGQEIDTEIIYYGKPFSYYHHYLKNLSQTFDDIN